ncbi:MAG: carbohydrate kinase family protein [Lachnospiraceae bacterium]|nr:carbohydrate kinase family protein [Lachnospiraceae bacterium]
MKTLDIIGIGDASMDILVSVDRLPAHDDKVKGKILGKYPGGIISNFLCAAAKFGASCGGIICVGNDDYGKTALAELQSYGIDTSRCVIHNDDTYFTITCLDDSGEKSMLICMNQTTQPIISEIDFSYLDQAEFVHMIGTYSDLVRKVGRYVREKDIRLSVDIERQAFTIPLEERMEICSLAFVAFPNEEGISYFTGCDQIAEAAAKMLEWGTKIVVVTRGSNGVDVFTKDTYFHVPAIPVLAKDTTGAGDTFNACFLSCLVKGYALEQCAWLATASAACQIQKIGARTGMVSEEEALHFLNAEGVEITCI